MITEQEFKNHITNVTFTLDICKEWINGSGDPNIQNNVGNTALIIASSWGYLKIVQLLIESGAKLDLKNKYANTALIFASSWGRLDIVKLLLEKGADINIQNKDGRTALIVASYKSRSNIVKVLIEKGVNLDIQDNWGKTALYYQQENIQYIKIFLQSKQYSNKIKQLKRKNINFNQFINL